MGTYDMCFAEDGRIISRGLASVFFLGYAS